MAGPHKPQQAQAQGCPSSGGFPHPYCLAVAAVLQGVSIPAALLLLSLLACAVRCPCLQAIASMNPADVPFEGIKIQLKGRMSGKGGKASKKVWVWGRTGRKTVDDPVDYAHEAVVTRAGYIGIKVRKGPDVGAAQGAGGARCGSDSVVLQGSLAEEQGRPCLKGSLGQRGFLQEMHATVGQQMAPMPCAAALAGSFPGTYTKGHLFGVIVLALTVAPVSLRLPAGVGEVQALPHAAPAVPHCQAGGGCV